MASDGESILRAKRKYVNFFYVQYTELEEITRIDIARTNAL